MSDKRYCRFHRLHYQTQEYGLFLPCWYFASHGNRGYGIAACGLDAAADFRDLADRQGLQGSNLPALGQSFERQFGAQGRRSRANRTRCNQARRRVGSGIARTPARQMVLEAPLDIGGDPRIEGSIGAFDEIEVPDRVQNRSCGNLFKLINAVLPETICCKSLLNFWGVVPIYSLV